MGNPFDQFDTRPANPFDAFDQPRSGTPRNPKPRRGEWDASRVHNVPEFVPPGVEGYNPETGEVENTGWMDKLGAFSAGTLNGFPIAGPYLLEGANALSAKLNPFSDKSEDQLRAEGRRNASDAMHDNPWTAGAGGVTGAVAGTLPAISAAPSLFGAGGGGLFLRSMIGGATGTGIGATDATVRGEDPARGALQGGLAGVAGPAAGDIIGAGYRGVVDWLGRRGISRMSDLTPETFQLLRGALEADGIPPTALQQRLSQLGPDAMLADLGPNLQQTAAGLVALPGEGRAIVQNAVRARDAGANQSIRSTVDSELGAAPIPSRVDAGIVDSQRSLGPLYEDALRDARAVNTQAVADELDSAVVNLRGDAQRVLGRVREMLNVRGTTELDPHPGALLQTRQAIDGMLDGATDGNVRRALGNARRMVDEELTRAVPGIKAVDGRYAELARQRGALERGQTVFDSGRTAPRPQELAEEFRQDGLPQGQMVGPSAVPTRLREGARAEIERIIGTNANDRVALQRLIKGEGDWNPQKLATMWGEDKARRVLHVLDAERTFAETSDFVTRNSATAARQEAVKSLKGEGAGGLSITDAYKAGGTMGAVRSQAVDRTMRILQALKGGNADLPALARVLSSQPGRAIIQALSRGPAQPALAASDVANIARALMLGPATTTSGR